MNTTPFKKDDTAFLEDGDEVIYIAQADRQHVVAPVYDDGDEFGPRYGSPILVNAVYREPPVEKRFAKIAELDEQIRQAQAKLSEINADVRTQEKARAGLLERLKQIGALQHIDDFLAGKITHFVIYDDYEVRVSTANDALEDGERYSRSQKLLTLFGDTAGDLQWKINRYRDGSGHAWENVMPFTSLDHATAFAVDLLATRFADPEIKPHILSRVVASAKALDVPVPDHVTAKIMQAAEEQAATRKATLEKEIENLEKALSDKRAAAGY